MSLDALEIRSVPVSTLLPVETRGVSGPHLKALWLDYQNGETPDPSFVTPYGDEGNILLDGTHRAYLADWREDEMFRAYAVTSDKDVAWLRFALWAIWDCSTIADIHRKYKDLWLPKAKALGIIGVRSLPVYPEPRARCKEREAGLQWP